MSNDDRDPKPDNVPPDPRAEVARLTAALDEARQQHVTALAELARVTDALRAAEGEWRQDREALQESLSVIRRERERTAEARKDLARVTGERDALKFDVITFRAVQRDRDQARADLAIAREALESYRRASPLGATMQAERALAAERTAHAATRADRDTLARLAGAVVEKVPRCDWCKGLATWVSARSPAIWYCAAHSHMGARSGERLPGLTALAAHLASGGRDG